MVDNEQLDLEFAYTSYADSCKDPYSVAYQCRRPYGHKPSHEHAAGFGDQRVIWTSTPETEPVSSLPGVTVVVRTN